MDTIHKETGGSRSNAQFSIGDADGNIAQTDLFPFYADGRNVQAKACGSTRFSADPFSDVGPFELFKSYPPLTFRKGILGNNHVYLVHRLLSAADEQRSVWFRGTHQETARYHDNGPVRFDRHNATGPSSL